MSAHTPGPWSVDNAYDGDVRSESGDVAIAVYRDMAPIEVGGQATLAPIRREEAHANARLIAAAPELLEAAMDAYELLKLIHDETGKVGTQLRAAIAKAKGESV